MVFTKQHQQRLLDKYVTENPSATALEMQAYISGVEEGILQHIEYIKTLTIKIKQEYSGCITCLGSGIF